MYLYQTYLLLRVAHRLNCDNSEIRNSQADGISDCQPALFSGPRHGVEFLDRQSQCGGRMLGGNALFSLSHINIINYYTLQLQEYHAVVVSPIFKHFIYITR